MQISFSTSVKMSLALLTAVSVFHALILVKIVPYSIAWGGRLTNDAEMYRFEIVSILVNLLMMWVVLMKANRVKFKFPHKAIQVILWIFVVIFVLNTVGNLLAKTTFEQFFALVTALLAYLFWQMVRVKG